MSKLVKIIECSAYRPSFLNKSCRCIHDGEVCRVCKCGLVVVQLDKMDKLLLDAGKLKIKMKYKVSQYYEQYR